MPTYQIVLLVALSILVGVFIGNRITGLALRHALKTSSNRTAFFRTICKTCPEEYLRVADEYIDFLSEQNCQCDECKKDIH